MTNNKEPNKNILESFIDKELEIKPNPFLASKVIEKIVAQESERRAKPIISHTHNKTYKLAFNIAMSVGAAAILALGVFLGNSYTTKENFNSQTKNSLAINDTHLENLYLYNVEE